MIPIVRRVFSSAWRVVRPRRRWLRFSLATVFALTTIACVVLGVNANRAHYRALAIRAIERAGGRVVYAHQVRADDLDPVIPSLLQGETRYWVRKLGNGYADVAAVQLPAAHFDETVFDGIGLFSSVHTLKNESPSLDDARLLKLRGLKQLKNLQLWRTSVTDAGLGALAGMQLLERVVLIDAPIEGPGLAHLADKTAMTFLLLNDTDVGDDSLAHLADLGELTHVELAGTQITDDGLKHLAGLTKLQNLNLSGTQVIGAGLRHVAGLTQLQRIDLSNTPLEDAGLEHLAGLKDVTQLDLSRTNITGTGLAHLGGLIKLEQLDLSRTQVDDAGIKSLPVLPALQQLSAPGTKIGDAGAAWLAKFPGLVRLQLDDTRVGDAGAAALGALPRLQHMGLSRCDVGDEGFLALVRAPQMYELDVHDCLITDAGLDALPMSFRGSVGLNGTRVTAAGVRRFLWSPWGGNQLNWRARPRRGAAAQVSHLKSLATFRDEDSAESLWEKSVAVAIANYSFGKTTNDRVLSARTIAKLFQTAIARSQRPAPIFVAWGDSQPGRHAKATARDAIERCLGEHPEADLLRQLLEGADPRMMCYAAAAALDPTYETPWERVATFAEDVRLGRNAAEAAIRQNPDNAVGHFLLAARLGATASAKERLACLQRGLAASRLECHDTPLPPSVIARAGDASAPDNPLDVRWAPIIGLNENFVDGFQALAEILGRVAWNEGYKDEAEERLMALTLLQTFVCLRDAAIAEGSMGIGALRLPRFVFEFSVGTPNQAAKATKVLADLDQLQQDSKTRMLDKTNNVWVRLDRLLPDVVAKRRAVAAELQTIIEGSSLAGSLDWLVPPDPAP